MELPHLGKHCSVSTCNKLDFLPIKCDACNQIFCHEHYNYTVHSCANAYKKNNQIPVCPLCNIPVPLSKGQLPDVVVGRHIDNDCQSDPAKSRRKVFTNKCSVKGCKLKEIIPVLCNECTLNFCLKHRHPTDHNCEGKAAATRRKALQAAVARQNPAHSGYNTNVSKVQGNMSDDEALARALALSMQETNKKTQEELDLALAKQLQASENPTAVGGSRSNTDRCNVS